MGGVNRREFLKYSGIVGGGVLLNMDYQTVSANTESLSPSSRPRIGRTASGPSLSALGINPVRERMC